MKIVLGVTGSIAAYKSAEIIRLFQEREDEVQVILTRTAAEFITPVTLSVLSKRPVYQSLFDPGRGSTVDHVELAAWADLLLIAPATAEVIGKLAHGLADDFLSTYALAHSGPVLLAPAMETAMWSHAAVAANVETLTGRGIRLCGPASGALASGGEGVGRMAEPEEIVEAATALVEGREDLRGIRVLVTAGATREPIDPIRFVSNRSSGKMGCAIADRARARGAEVTLLAGAGVHIGLPRGVGVRRFETSADLKKLLEAEFSRCDVLVMAAAVSDFIPEKVGRRLHRSEGTRSIALSPGEDLLGSLSREKGSRVIVAFAAETGDGQEQRAREKLAAKNADWIVLNDVSKAGAGFEAEENEVVLLSSTGKRIEVPRRDKSEVAEKIWDAISSTLSWRMIHQKA